MEQPNLKWSQIPKGMSNWRLGFVSHDVIPDVADQETTKTFLLEKWFPIAEVRDWLDHQQIDYSMTGLYHELYTGRDIGFCRLYAVRFEFTSFDDKLFFCLRWL